MSFDRCFDELSLGDAVRSPARTVTEEDIATFAALTGDTHPLHVDAAWAARSPFGHRVAHGMLVLSCAVGLVPLAPEQVVALRGVREAVFKRPVAIGDTVAVGVEVARLRALDATTGLVGCSLKIVNQRDELCARAQVDLVWRRAGAAVPASAA